MNEMGPKLWIFSCVVVVAGQGQSDAVIHECSSGKVSVTEETGVKFTCSSYCNTEWVFWHNRGYADPYIGYCNGNVCDINPSLQSLYYLQGRSNGLNECSTELYIGFITRYQALDRELVCRDLYLGGTSKCKLRVIVPAVRVIGSCSLQILQWHVLGSCNFRRMYDSDNNYTCVWRRNEDEILTEIQDRAWYNTTNRPYGRYVKGTCLYNQSIPIETGNYSYNVSTSTGPLYVFPTDISIIVPGQPEHDCTKMVSEGSDITCTCRSSVIGNPPATVEWDGLNSQTLFLQNVRRENNSLVYTCRLTWGPDDDINRSVSYVLRVKPSSEVNDTESKGSVNGGLIGGILAAVIIILIIIAVISVYIIRRRKGVSCKERGVMGYFSGVHQLLQRRSPVEEPYAAVNKPGTQPPIARHAAPSGDLYTIASTTTGGRASDEYAAVRQVGENEAYGPDSNDELQATKAAQQMEKVKPPVMPKPTKASVKTFPNVSGTGYVNVTEVPTDSGLGVYHIVPWAGVSGETQTISCDTAAPVISEDEYNVLQLENDRTQQDDQTGTYHHLQLQ